MSADARRLYDEGVAAFRAGDQRTSREKNEAALELARASDDAEAEALALVGLSRVALREGDYDAVCSLAREARERIKGLDPAAEARPLHLLAAGTRLSGHYDEARQLYGESLELSRTLGDDHGVWMELHNLGFVELHRGDVDEASRLFAEAAMLHGEDPYDVAMTELERAAVAAVHGDLGVATEAITQAEARLHDAGIALDPDDQFEVDWLRQILRERA